MVKPYIKHKNTTDTWGNPRVIYTTLDMKIQIELCTRLNGDYWWTKLKSTLDIGNDGAWNFSREQCLAISEIYKAIEEDNLKAVKSGKQTK